MTPHVKNMFRSVGIAMLSGSLLVVLQVSAAAPMSAEFQVKPHSVPEYVRDEVLVKFKSNVSSYSRDQSIRSAGAQTIRALNQGGLVHLKVAPGATVEQAMAVYMNDPNVESVQPNYIYHIAAAPNDTSYGQQWSLKNTGQNVNAAPVQPGGGIYATNNPGTSGDDMGIEAAWNEVTDCSSVTVAVIDTGVNYNHADLLANMWNGVWSGQPTVPNHGWNYVNGNNDPMDHNGHGTHVAGTIGAVGDNGLGIAGVCWKASIMAIRVLDASGTGTTANITQGVDFAVAHGAKVINMSIGGSGFDAAFSSAITSAQTNGVVVVVAAGNSTANNDSGTTPTYPCNYTQPNLLCVAALDQRYALASFSNYGATSVDVGAPGTNVVSTWAGANALISGSSWTFSTTAGGGWTAASGTLGGLPADFLLNPSNMLSGGPYRASTDDRAYSTINIPSVDNAFAQGYLAINVINNDFFRINYKASGDPFSSVPTSGTTLVSVTNTHTANSFSFGSFDITSSGCINASCSFGFQLTSTASGTKDWGVGVANFSIKTLSLNTASYNTINGTSMASPHVAGLATLLRAYNPSFTATEVVNAIKNGGTTVAALSGITTTGKAVNAMGALAYINTPTGLSASVQ